MRREIRLRRPGRGDEKLHRAVSGYVCGFLMLGRHIQRRNAVNVLALDVQDLPARGQNDRSWAHAYDSFRQPGCGVDHVLAIVENQQKSLGSDRPSDGLGGYLVATELQAEAPRHGGRHQTGIRQRGQLDQPDATLEARKQAAGHL